MRPESFESRYSYSNAFQYRKRYEVTCDLQELLDTTKPSEFQYRKRYEVTCDSGGTIGMGGGVVVSIPQAV